MDIKVKMYKYLIKKDGLKVIEGYGIIQHNYHGYFVNPKAYNGNGSIGEPFNLKGIDWNATTIETSDIDLRNRYGIVYVVGERNDLLGIYLLKDRVKIKAEYDIRYKEYYEILENMYKMYREKEDSKVTSPIKDGAIQIMKDLYYSDNSYYDDNGNEYVSEEDFIEQNK